MSTMGSGGAPEWVWDLWSVQGWGGLQEFRVFGCWEKVLREGSGAGRDLHGCGLSCCHEEGMESRPKCKAEPLS